MEQEYTIKRSSSRKKLTITVERDRSVVVHAPVSTSEARIQEIVHSKRQWIYEKMHHPQKYSDLPHPPGKELVNGESALYLGRHYQIEIVDEGIKSVQFDHCFRVPALRTADRRKAMQNWYVERANEQILPRVKKFADSLGVNYSEAKIVGSLYRWGSCTTRDNVTFNWKLIKAPMFVVDYVIVHELTHLMEPNHTPRFWNIVRAQSPKAEKAKQWLLEHGQLLEGDI
ncbi:MAG: SprT family zinc-dependent metalloprotease [Kiritimatiellia bacterium]